MAASDLARPTSEIGTVRDSRDQSDIDGFFFGLLTLALWGSFCHIFSLWNLTSGCAQLVGVNTHFRLCDGCTLLHHTCEVGSWAVRLQAACILLGFTAALLACACWKVTHSEMVETSAKQSSAATSKQK